MKSFTLYLYKEHLIIQEKLSVLKCNCLSQLREGRLPEILIWNDLMNFFSDFADQVHHHKEEKYLIPALISKGFPYKGGPECGYFKSLQMMNVPLEEQIQDLEDLLEEKHEKVTVDTTMPILVEHIIGRKLLKAMKLFYLKVQEHPSFISTLYSLVFRYVSFLEEHIDKENRCLFPMADETLSEKEQEALLRQMEEALE